MNAAQTKPTLTTQSNTTYQRWLGSRRNQWLLQRLIIYVLLLLGGFIMVIPFFWLLTSSLKAPSKIYVLPPQWIPSPIQWQNYPTAVTSIPYWDYALNTLTITVGAMLGTIITSSMAGFAYGRLRWPGRDFLFTCMLSTLMMPNVVLMIPTYILYKYLGWLDSFLPLTVPYWFGGGAFNIFLMRQFMMTIPKDLDDAARVDGANAFTIYTRLLLPLCRPALAIVAIFSFIYHWNDFMGPLIYLTNPDLRTLSLGLNYFKDMFRVKTELIMAGSTIMITPIILLFLLAQQYFVQGIALTGLKG
ncbi:MAG: carbohydrate ABC transporter permease [Caldilineaceae bacterium]